MTVLRPDENTQAGIRALHSSFMRRALAPAGIWTVEAGEMFGGLHLNILSPKPAPARWRNCKSYSELVQVTAREAAAYITKRSSMPAPQQYSGRIYGSWGKLGDLLASDRMPEVVQAGSIEATLSGAGGKQMPVLNGVEYRTEAEEAKGWKEGAPFEGRRVWWTLDGKEWTYKHPAPKAADYAEVARKNLANLYALGLVRKREAA